MSNLSAMGSNMDMSMMQGARHAHHKPNASQLTSDVFSKLDPSGQGSIDSQSFLAALSSQTSQAQGANGAAPAVSQDDASKFFSAMDSNGDGKVTQQEMTDMFQKVSDQFKTRMQMQQASGTEAATQQGVQGHHHHGHKPDGDADDMMQQVMNGAQAGTTSASGATSPTDAIMQALTAAQAGTTTANTNSATNTADQLQRQLMSMMRRYEQMSAGTTMSSTASTAATAATGSVSIAA